MDDPVGAISVHGVSGAWGVLSIGLFANGSFGAGWNGIHTLAKDGSEIGVAGAFGTLFGSPANDWSQLGAQAVGAFDLSRSSSACSLTCGSKYPVSSSRCVRKREDEIAGLDLPEMGAECYPDFHLTDKGTSHNE